MPVGYNMWREEYIVNVRRRYPLLTNWIIMWSSWGGLCWFSHKVWKHSSHDDAVAVIRAFLATYPPNMFRAASLTILLMWTSTGTLKEDDCGSDRSASSPLVELITVPRAATLSTSLIDGPQSSSSVEDVKPSSRSYNAFCLKYVIPAATFVLKNWNLRATRVISKICHNLLRKPSGHSLSGIGVV